MAFLDDVGPDIYRDWDECNSGNAWAVAFWVLFLICVATALFTGLTLYF